MLTKEILLPLLLTAVVSYLLGSLNFGVIVSRLYARDDVRAHGSGNAGMTNVLRTYGKWPAFYTFLGDFSKGLIATALARLVFFSPESGLPFNVGYVAGVFVLLGHCFPVFFGFRGGKGVLTALAIILIISPITFLALLVLLVPVLLITKTVSLVSVTGAALYPLITYIVCTLTRVPATYDTLFACLFGALVLYMHRANIKRLINGTESKFGQKKK